MQNVNKAQVARSGGEENINVTVSDERIFKFLKTSLFSLADLHKFCELFLLRKIILYESEKR